MLINHTRTRLSFVFCLFRNSFPLQHRDCCLWTSVVTRGWLRRSCFEGSCIVSLHQFYKMFASFFASSEAAGPSAPTCPARSWPDARIPCTAVEASTSMDPKDYVWSPPTPAQQQQLYVQFSHMAWLCYLHHQAAVAACIPPFSAPHAFPCPIGGLPNGEFTMLGSNWRYFSRRAILGADAFLSAAFILA